MATPTQKQQPWLVSGPALELLHAPVAATQTWGIGSPVYLNQGALTLCVNSDAAEDKAIVGYAATAIAAPTTGTEVYYYRICEPAKQFFGVYVSASGTDAAAPTTLIGDDFGHRIEASSPFAGYMTLDTDLTSHVSMRVEDVMRNRDTKIDNSATPGVAVVRFLEPAIVQEGP